MSNSLKVIIDFIVLAILYVVVFFNKWRTRGKAKLVVNTLMYIYISLVLYVTLMPIVVSLPFIFNHPYIPMNMIPFDDYLSGRGGYSSSDYTQCNYDDAIWIFVTFGKKAKFTVLFILDFFI